MKKDRRVKDAREFQRIMTIKKYRNSKRFSVYIDKRKTTQSRIGISVPKKLGNAVVRNRAKRQVRAMLEDTLSVIHEYDYIVLVRRDYFNYSYDDNKKDLENIIKTVKM